VAGKNWQDSGRGGLSHAPASRLQRPDVKAGRVFF